MIKRIFLLVMPFLMKISIALATVPTGDEKVTGAIWWVGQGCRAAGVVAIIFGAWQLGMSFSTDEPGYRTKALYFLACGIVLFWAPGIMEMLMRWNIIDPTKW